MTRILFDPRADSEDGSVPIGAVVTASATRMREDGAVVIYPATLVWAFTAEKRPVMELDAPAASWAWTFQVEPEVGRRTQRTARWAPADELTWSQLDDVDPTTLEPSTPDALAAWQAVLAEVDAARADVLAASAPVLDAPDFTLILENGLI